MENDDIQIGRVLTRREALQLLGAAGFVLVAGCGTGTGTGTGTGNNNTGIVVTPDLTEGPFFVDERLNRSDLTTNTTRASVVNGLPLTLRLTVSDVNGSTTTPASGVQVDIWHADAIGTYSDENNGEIQNENTLGQNWLRGYQITDANGIVQFTTIYPGWYAGRTVHIHFKVRLFAANGTQAYEFTSQFFIDDAINDIVLANAPYNSRGTRTVRNANDGIYNGTGTDGITDGTQLTLALTPVTNGPGYVATFNINLQIP